MQLPLRDFTWVDARCQDHYCLCPALRQRKFCEIICILESEWPRIPLLAADHHSLVNAFFYHHLCSPHCDYWMSQAYKTHRMLGTMVVDEPCLCNIEVWLPASSKKLSTQPRRKNGFSQEQPKFHYPNVNIVLKTLHTSSFWKDLCFWAYILLLIAWNLSLSDLGLCGAS